MIYGEFDEDSRKLTTYKDGQRLSTVRIDDVSPAFNDRVCSIMTESVNGQERICVYLAPRCSSFGPSRVLAFNMWGMYKGSRNIKGAVNSIH